MKRPQSHRVGSNASHGFGVVLPDGSGIDLIRAVRNDFHKTMPAVALTGFGMDEDVKRTLEAGFNDHLTKPINFARLEEAIQHACKGEAAPTCAKMIAAG